MAAIPKPNNLSLFLIKCVDCGDEDLRYQSTLRCPECRKKHNSKKSSLSYHKKHGGSNRVLKYYTVFNHDLSMIKAIVGSKDVLVYLDSICDRYEYMYKGATRTFVTALNRGQEIYKIGNYFIMLTENFSKKHARELISKRMRRSAESDILKKNKEAIMAYILNNGYFSPSFKSCLDSIAANYPSEKCRKTVKSTTYFVLNKLVESGLIKVNQEKMESDHKSKRAKSIYTLK